MGKVICIDAGHGGADPGAVGVTGVKEKDINLLVAQKVRDKLADNYLVVMTRDKDTYLNLSGRAEIANEEGASLFISIHCNAFTNPKAEGVETFHYHSSTQGKLLALEIQRSLAAVTGAINRGVKSASFKVLRDTAMPAVLVELGFLTNAKEEKLLNTEKYQDTCAEAIAHGIKEYFAR